MVKIYILASGSKGNSVIIENKGKYLGIDLGITNKRFLEKISSLSINKDNLSSLIITHEHRDHIDGAYIFLKNNPHVKCYLTNGTYKGSLFYEKGIANYELIKQNDEFMIDDFKINTIATNHDAREPIGLVITINNKKVTYITDTGYIDNKYDDLISESDIFLIEANHEINMVMQTPKRPYPTKLRIISDHGHMDNDYITKKLNDFLNKHNKKVIWGVMHISDDCNTIDNIERHVCQNIEKLENLELVYSSQDIKIINLEED